MERIPHGLRRLTGGYSRQSYKVGTLTSPRVLCGASLRFATVGMTAPFGDVAHVDTRKGRPYGCEALLGKSPPRLVKEGFSRETMAGCP